MLYNRCMGIYKFGNNTYPRCTRHRLNFFRGKKCVLWAVKYGNTVVVCDKVLQNQHLYWTLSAVGINSKVVLSVANIQMALTELLTSMFCNIIILVIIN